MARKPMFGHTFFGHNSAISGLIGLKIFKGVQETIIYWLVMRNLSYSAYFSFLIFGPLLVKKWAWPPRTPLFVWSLRTQPKSWPTGLTFWANRYLEIMFSKFSGVNQNSYIIFQVINRRIEELGISTVFLPLNTDKETLAKYATTLRSVFSVTLVYSEKIVSSLPSTRLCLKVK